MVTAVQLRKCALTMPEVQEKSHFGQPDFRVRGKIFACLSRDGMRGTVKLSLAVQAKVLATHPKVFYAASGRWGRSGWTEINLAILPSAKLDVLMLEAWTIMAPKGLLAAYRRGAKS
jgi:hypothetical protein